MSLGFYAWRFCIISLIVIILAGRPLDCIYYYLLLLCLLFCYKQNQTAVKIICYRHIKYFSAIAHSSLLKCLHGWVVNNITYVEVALEIVLIRVLSKFIDVGCIRFANPKWKRRFQFLENLRIRPFPIR